MKGYSLPPGTLWAPGRFLTPEDIKTQRRIAAANRMETIIAFNGEGCFMETSGGGGGNSIGGFRVEFDRDICPTVELDLSKIPPVETGVGLVLTTQLQRQGSRLHFGGGIDPMELRSGILLWKHIVVPESNALKLDPGEDAEFLIAEGHATVVKGRLRGSWDVSEAVTDTVMEVVERLRARDANRWSVARGPAALSVMEDGPSREGAIFRLHRGIPIPDRHVPLTEVLVFKSKRAAELERLHSAIIGIAKGISDEPNRPLAEQVEREKLSTAIDDHLRVSREWKVPLRIASVDTKIDLKTWVTAAGAFASTASYSLPIQVASGLLGAAAASVTIKPALRRRSTESPYEYVWQYHKELFGH